MGKIVKANLPCKACKSSDARRLYEDGTSFCFSCEKFFPKDNEEVEEHGIDCQHTERKSPKMSPSITKKTTSVTLADVEGFQVRGFRDRGITKEACAFFGVKVSYGSDGTVDGHYYPYVTNGELSYKHRVVATKNFFWVGEAGDLFGMDRFQGGGKRLIITEGEIDALSVAQASLDKYQKVYPVISVTSATGTAKLLAHRDWIRSFQEVCIWFDNDERGQEALDKALKIIGVDKAKIIRSPNDCKDANDVLVKIGTQGVMQSVWDAQAWTPAGIITRDNLWEALCNYNSIPSIPYPDCMDGINSKVKGMRLGEIALFISGTGSGKSTLLREIMLHLLEHEAVPKDNKVGIISLEEAPAETARKLSGMVLRKNPANEEIPIEELKVGFDQVFGDDRVVLLDHQGSIADGSIVDQLEYMALMGCKYLFIDHITILVSEGAGGLTGNEAIDKVMNDLLRLVKRHNVWIGLVSHLRKSPVGGKAFEDGNLPNLDDIRGSGSIKQISFDIIAFARDMSNENEVKRNTIKMSALKSRYTGLTGSTSGAYYDHQTGRLMKAEDAPDVEFTKIE
jgi:twinkle protein